MENFPLTFEQLRDLVGGLAAVFLWFWGMAKFGKPSAPRILASQDDIEKLIARIGAVEEKCAEIKLALVRVETRQEERGK